MFQNFKDIGDIVVGLLDPAKSVTLVAGLQTIVSTWAVIYILYIAYMFHLGKVDNPVRQIVYKMMMFGFISLFAFNAGEWYTYSINAIKGLSDWLAGGSIDVIFAKLDDGILTIDSLSNIFFEHDSIKWLKLLAIMGTGIIFLSYMLVALFASILLVINMVTLQVVIVLAPFAFVSLFFPKINAIFDRWLEMIIANVFTIFFLSLFTNAIFDVYISILNKLDPVSVTPGFIYDSTNVTIFMTTFTIFAFSVLAFVLLRLSTSLAEKLSAVSIESAPTGAMISTAIMGYAGGKMAGKGVKAGKSAGKSAGRGIGKTIGAVSGVSRSAGNAGSKAHGLLKETGKKATAERRAGGKKS